MINLYNCLQEDLIKTIPDSSIDIICIDPPYLYLKNQKLERYFDERAFFSECKRILTNKGFVILFGRGPSFYRWNTILADLGFVFKEEIVWDKCRTTSPVLPISRVHETIALFSTGNSSVNRVKVPFMEAVNFDDNKIIEVIRRIKTAFGNRQSFELLENYYSQKEKKYNEIPSDCHSATVQPGLAKINRTLAFATALEEGMSEKSIIKISRDHYNTIHPTQKPVRLIERLLALCLPDKPRNKTTVADFFGGSFSAMEACHNMGLNGVSCEVDREYFDAGKKRIDLLKNKLF